MAYCDRCDRSFPHDSAYEQHRSDSYAHWLCDSCDIDFGSEESLDQHYGNSSKHHYCKDCDRHFDSAHSKMQHLEAKHWYCETHNRVRIAAHDDYNPVALSREWLGHVDLRFRGQPRTALQREWQSRLLC